ncbi:MAG: cytochrome c peroxidase [Bacteroidota bacterium]
MKKFILLSTVAIFAFLSFQFKPVDAPKTEEELGKLLFFDNILSADKSISCASCHKPNYAFADTSAFSVGVGGKLGNRNTPSAMNMFARDFLFWDGRAKSLEEQALGPIENPVEMNLPIAEAVKRLNESESYKKYFKTIYKENPSKENLAKAISAFERTLETSNSAFDKWADDTLAISESARRGRRIFVDKAKCFECHFGPDFTVDEFRNIGLYNEKEYTDKGRYEVTKDKKDIGKFKVPGLRNVAVTAPYMHNGSFKTLRDVIEYYNEPSKFTKGSINRDTLITEKLNLSEQEKQDIEAFLLSLTDKQFLKQ